MNFVVDLYDEDEEKWEKHRSVYISMKSMIELDFDENSKKIDLDFNIYTNCYNLKSVKSIYD